MFYQILSVKQWLRFNFIIFIIGEILGMILLDQFGISIIYAIILPIIPFEIFVGLPIAYRYVIEHKKIPSIRDWIRLVLEFYILSSILVFQLYIVLDQPEILDVVLDFIIDTSPILGMYLIFGIYGASILALIFYLRTLFDRIDDRTWGYDVEIASTKIFKSAHFGLIPFFISFSLSLVWDSLPGLYFLLIQTITIPISIILIRKWSRELLNRLSTDPRK